LTKKGERGENPERREKERWARATDHPQISKTNMTERERRKEKA